MDDQELRTYAVRGLTSRLAELDAERERVTALLAELTGSTNTPASPARKPLSAEGRQRIGAAARKRWAAHRAAAQDSAPASVADTVSEAEPEVARVLPRRGRVLRSAGAQEPDAAPALPPMPRLIKKVS